MPGDPLSRRLATIVALDVAGYSAYVDSNVVLWELAPDQRMELGWFWLAVDRHAAVVSVRREGKLADGGVFESDYIWLAVATGGRAIRVELFEIDALDTALARALRGAVPRRRLTPPCRTYLMLI